MRVPGRWLSAADDDLAFQLPRHRLLPSLPCGSRVRSALLAGLPHLDRDAALVADDRVVAHELDPVVVISEQAVKEANVLRQLEALVDGRPILVGNPTGEMA